MLVYKYTNQKIVCNSNPVNGHRFMDLISYPQSRDAIASKNECTKQLMSDLSLKTKTIEFYS